MKQVDFKIKYEHLKILNEVFARMPDVAESRDERAARSLFDALSRKLMKKQLSKIDNHSKPFKITLEYYEATGLANIAEFGQTTEPDIYKKNALHLIFHTLDQILA